MISAALKNKASIVPLTRETLQDQVFRRVTELILDGSIVPGQMVTVQSLADAFGVSPMPVREALRRLSAADALTVVSGRSIGIPALSRARLSDLRNVRFEVEAIAGGWAAERCNDALRASLRQLLEALDGANAAGDVKAYLRANYAFHFTIYRASESENLLRIIENLWLQISPYFNMLHDSGNYSTSNRHHREMFTAICERDVERVQKAIRADIDGAYHVLMGVLD